MGVDKLTSIFTEMIGDIEKLEVNTGIFVVNKIHRIWKEICIIPIVNL